MVKSVRLLMSCGLSLGLLAACQTTVSVEEAKTVTATFEGQAFTPPPRKIEDVRLMLNAAAEQNKEELARLRKTADGPSPESGSVSERAQAYRDRATAAGELGRLQQAISDLNSALATGLDDKWDLSRIYMGLSHAVVGNGDLRNGFELRKKSLDLVQGERRGTLMRNSRNAVLAVYSARLGDFEAAEAYLAAARSSLSDAYQRSGRGNIAIYLALGEALTLFAEGGVAKVSGDYAEAEAKLRNGLSVIDEDIAGGENEDEPLSIYKMGTGRKLVRLVILADLARVLAHRGQFAEAEVIARDGVKQAVGRFGRNSIYAAQAIDPMVFILSRTGRMQEARVLADIALDILQSLGVATDGHSQNKARRTVAEVMVAEGDWTGALGLFERIAGAVKNNQRLLDRFYFYDLNRAVALLATGQPEMAAAVTEPASKLLIERLGVKHIDAAEAIGLNGVVLQGLGRTDDALDAFRESVPILTQASRQSDSGSTNAGANQRLRIILEGYLDALGGRLTPEAATEAFRVANMARGRRVQAALAGSAARAGIKDPELKDLVRREQDARERIAALYGVLSNALAEGGGGAAVGKLRQSIDSLRGARGALMGEIEDRFPDYASIINPKPADIAGVRKSLAGDEAVVTFYVTDKRTYVWAFQNTGPVAFHASEIGRERLSDVVSLLRGALDPQVETLGDIPLFDLAEAHGLYRSLLEPVSQGWREAAKLIVVTDGDLGHLPLGVLPTAPTHVAADTGLLFAEYRDVPWLAKSHAIMLLPSAGSLATLRSLTVKSGKAMTFAGFGDPWFNVDQAQEATAEAATQIAMRGGVKARGVRLLRRNSPTGGEAESYTLNDLPRLPDTAAEIRSMAAALKADAKRDVFLGRKAGEGTVKAMKLNDRRIIAFATHGLVPGDLDGLVQPALALSAPEVAGGADDGLLTMDEIMALDLNADWIVLSACNTAAGDGAGAEAISGLGRAFFYAGARALLATGWPVESVSARELTESLFAKQQADPSLSRAGALMAAQAAMIAEGVAEDDQGRQVFSYAHPIFWAPFMLFGDGGGGNTATN